MPPKNKKIIKSLGFEEALTELETLVLGLESGEQSLEESLAQFERGISLTRHCQQSLKNAEQKVQVLMEGTDSNGDGVANLENLDAADDAD